MNLADAKALADNIAEKVVAHHAAIDSLPEDHPIRTTFAALHGKLQIANLEGGRHFHKLAKLTAAPNAAPTTAQPLTIGGTPKD